MHNHRRRGSPFVGLIVCTIATVMLVQALIAAIVTLGIILGVVGGIVLAIPVLRAMLFQTIAAQRLSKAGSALMRRR